MKKNNGIVSLAVAAVLLLSAVLVPQPAAASGFPDDFLTRVYSIDHYLPVGNGERLFVTVHFTIASLLREPARGALFLTGPEFRGNFWTIPVEGYNGPAMAAKRGFIAYTYDYIGAGESTIPADGTQINYLTQVGPARKLVDFMRYFWGIDRIDLIGEGYGAEIASELADEPERTRSVTLTVVAYKNYDPAILAFLSPEFEAFLRSFTDGYYEPNFLPLTLQFSTDQDLIDYVFATQLGSYPTGPALQFWDFPPPIIDAAAAQVPGLVIIGALDPFPAAGDPAELADDWGGGADLVLIEGSFHVPRIEAPDIAAQYFAAFFDFIDP